MLQKHMFDCAGDAEEPLDYQVKALPPLSEFIQPFSL